MANGITPYGDDFLGLVTGSLLIPAMPFPIAVRQGSWNVLRTWFPEIKTYSPISIYGEQLKFLPIVQPTGLVEGNAIAIVFCKWVPGAVISEREMTTADVIDQLNASGFWVRHDRASISDFLSWLDPMLKVMLQYGDLMDAVERITALLR